MFAKAAQRTTIALALVVFFATGLFAHPPWGIVVSSTGIVYFSDLETVWRIDRNGNLSVFRPGVGGRHVHELSIDGEDNVYGPDYIYDPATDKYFLGVWKKRPEGTETVLQPPIDIVMSGVSIWHDRAGNMYSIEQNNHTKERTLLLRRTPDGRVSTLAGGTYGHADGQGTAAKFSSVTAMTFGPDGNIYLTDGTGVRRVTLDGDVKTIAKDITARSSEDKPTLFGGNDKNIFGLAVDAGGNIHVADAGNRRLVKVEKDGRVSVVYRLDPPYFPTGVFATPSGDVYVLEFSFTPPGTTDKPRVRKISSDGQNRIIATHRSMIAFGVMPPGSQVRSRFAGLIEFVNAHRTYFVIVIVLGLAIATILLWRRSRKQRI
jgi:hypothetical protein